MPDSDALCTEGLLSYHDDLSLMRINRRRHIKWASHVFTW